VLDRPWLDEAAGEVGSRSTAVDCVLDGAVSEADGVLGSRNVGPAASTREAVEEESTSAECGVVAGPTSLNPNFLNACAPSSAVATSQVRTRVS
jgi:hypothetical protein